MSDTRPPERALQQSIVKAMHGGATFAKVHKEGGSLMRYDRGHFERVEYGDNPARRVFASEDEFLAFLRRFHDTELALSPEGPPRSEAEAWQRIQRRLQVSTVQAHAPVRKRFSAVTVVAVVFTLVLAGVLAHLKWHPRAEALRAAAAGAAKHPVPAATVKAPETRDWQRLQDENRRSVEAAKAAARPATP